VNRYIIEDFQTGGTDNYMNELQNPSSMPFNVGTTFGATSQSSDQVLHEAPHLERGFSLDSALWSYAKERNVWNNGFEIKNSKQPVAEADFKSCDEVGVVGQWSQSSSANFAIENVNGMSLPLTDDAVFMQQMYGSTNEEVVV
jgi:hypothetical protein